jgi:HEAT repeat protein
MAVSSTLADLVNRMPDLDKTGELTGPEWSSAEVIYTQVLEGGPAAVAGLLELLVPPGEGNDYKARYLLHGLALYVCRPAGAQWRRMLLKELTRGLGGDRPRAVQAFIIQQLQTAGTAEEVPVLGALLSDADLCEPATQALLAIGPGAAEQFRQALGQARGAARLTIVRALGVMGDARSAEAVARLATQPYGDARLAALKALAGIGDPAAVDLLLKAADAAEGYERIELTEACFALADRIAAAGHRQDARKAYSHLAKTRTDASESHVREAAERALQQAG